MANNVYIGMRYVPIFDGDWDPSKSYEALVIVQYGNNTYTSKRPVPVGTLPTDTDYWALTGDYNGQISALDSRIDVLEAKIPEVENFAVDNAATSSPVVPVNLTYQDVVVECPNFRDELVIDRWTPFNDVNKELSLRSIASNQNATITTLKNGWQLVPNGGVLQVNLARIFKTKANQCIHFKVNGNKNNTEYCRTGLNLGTKMFLYFNNAENKVYYESASTSWTPTALGSATFNADVIEMWVFLQDKTAAVYVSADDGPITLVGTTPTNGESILGSTGLFVRMANGVSAVAKVWNLKLVYTYNSIADIKYVHYEDTTPMILNDKAYMTADIQAENCNFVGVLRHTLGQNDLELVGVVTSNYNPNSLALDMCFDRKLKRFIVLARVSANNGTGVAYAYLHNNSLSGQIPLVLTLLPNVANPNSFGNYSSDEDGAICFFNNKWYIAINRIVGSDYYYNVYESDSDSFDLTSFTLKSSIHATSLTGGCFLVVGNVLYLIAGNGTSITCFNALTGVNVGNVLSGISTRVWGNLTAVTKGNRTKFYLTTFDRTTYSSSAWSYGTLLLYESTDELDELIVPNTYGLK